MDVKDIERIMAISNLINNTPKNQNTEKNEKIQEFRNLEDVSKTSKLRNRINTLNNVLPYLEPSLQRGIYTAIKIMEVSEFNRNMPSISAQRKEKYVFDKNGFIEAAEKEMTYEEKRNFEALCAVTRIGSLNFLKGDAAK